MDNCNNVRKVPYDPGWNDPPTFSYNAQQTTPGKPRKLLNKRVAFPLSGLSPAPGSTPPINLPPAPLPNTPPIPPPLMPQTSTTNITSENIDTENVLIDVKSILLDFLESSSELGPKANDIKKRISVMEEMWINGKLNTQIQASMKELAHALKEDQPSIADDLHRALMVDHVSAVSMWMPGIKQLIHHCIARSELLAIDKEEN